MTTVKITELTNIGANLATSTLVPVVNMAGTPITQKTTVGNIANLILEGAGVDYPEATVALLAQTVSNAAQPNITSTGTLTGLTVSGNTNLGAVANVRITGGTSGYVLSTDGAGNLSWAAGGGGGSYGNSNVAAYLPTYTGNVGANWVIADYFSGNAHNLTYLPGANINGAVAYATTANSVAGSNVSGAVGLATYATTANSVAGANVSGQVSYAATANSVAVGNIVGIGNIATVNLDGNISNALLGNGAWGPVEVNVNSIYNGTSSVQIPLANGNVSVNVGSNSWSFTTDGDIHLPGNSYLITSGEIGFLAAANIAVKITTANSSNYTWSFNPDGSLLAPEQLSGRASIFSRDSNANTTSFVVFPTATNSNLTLGTNNGHHIVLNTDHANANLRWVFDDTGKITFPTLTVDLHNGGNQTAQTLQFGDDTQQAIITGPTPAANVNAQRLIIQGQRGNGTGEGGDVYFWAGDADTNGGDIKIYAGDADNVSTGSGGYINLDGGSGFDGGGQISVTGGYSTGGVGGPVYISAGQGANGGVVNINGGGASANAGGYVNIQGGFGQSDGGAVTIAGGGSALGLPGYGNVQITAGVSTWTFDNAGVLNLPGGTGTIESTANNISIYSDAGQLNGALFYDTGAEIYALQDFAIFTDNANASHIWRFYANGNMTAPGAINVGNMVIGTVPGDITADANTGVTFNVSGPDGGFAVNYLKEVGNANTSGGELAFSSETGNATYRISLSNDLGNGFATKIWRFDGTGNLALAGGNSIIQSLPNNAGDGSGLSTLNLYPDASTGDDRYLILDPTGPSHLHLRAGGVQDASNVLLYLGGEQTYVQVDDGYHRVTIGSYDIGNATGYNWRFDYDGNLVLPLNTFAVKYANGTQVPIVSSASGSNHQIQFNSNGAFGASANYTFTDTVGGGSVEVGNELLLLGNGTISTASNNLNIQPAGNLVVTASAYNWTFDTAGNLTLPGNTFAVNYANGSQASAPLVDITNTNGLATTYYPTFVENRTTGQIVRADVDLSYRSDTNTLTVGNITGNTNGYTLGYLNIPQVAASNATLALGDAGKHYYSTTAGNLTLTIPNNSTTSFATGTAISIVVQAAGNILVNAASGVTLYMAGNSTSANRVVGTYGMATLMKVASDTWFINGTGVS